MNTMRIVVTGTTRFIVNYLIRMKQSAFPMKTREEELEQTLFLVREALINVNRDIVAVFNVFGVNGFMKSRTTTLIEEAMSRIDRLGI